MHAFKFSSIAVLSCIAMIGAIPVGNRAPAEAIVRRQDGLGGEDVMYVPYCLARGGSDLVKKSFSRAGVGRGLGYVPYYLQ
jgi:hypothetical protein